MDNFGFNNQANMDAGRQLKQSVYAQLAKGPQAPEPALPMMVQEQDRLYGAVADLEMQLEWLIQKIQPVCQPAPVLPTGEANGKDQQIEATPSTARQALIAVRVRIDEMSRRIAGVKYTIEV